MSIGSFIITKNEGEWMSGHLSCWLPHLDQMVFLDGNSTDGTLEIIKAFQRDHPNGNRITLMEDQDPKDLQDDYVRKFNLALSMLNTEWAFFLHPDMVSPNPQAARNVKSGIAYSCRMRSFAGEPGGQLYEIDGRGTRWKNIYRLKNPDLGAHYFGHYGHADEDVYFRSITGDKHEHYGTDFHYYPYIVSDSGIEILHFSDVRSRERRIDRMVKCLLNNGFDHKAAVGKALSHPRVTFKNGDGLRFIPSDYPADFVAATEKYRHLRKEPACPAA